MDETLLNKLKSLGVKLGDHTGAYISRPVESFSVEKVLPGNVVHNALGECFVVSKTYPPDYIHGQMDLLPRSELGFIAEFSKLSHLSSTSTGQLVFLDTETTGLSPNAGTFPFLTGLCKSTSDGTQVALLLSRSPAEEPAMLEEMAKFLQGASAIVTYNGKTFDIPLLETRLSYHCLPSPFKEIGHIDLLILARKLWKNTLPSRSLGNVEMSILGVARAEEEVPGYLIPQIYYDYLRTGDARPLAGVLYHNEMDIISLVALLNHFIQLSSNEIEHLNPLDILSVANLLMDFDDPSVIEPLLDRIFLLDEQTLDWSIFHKLADWYKSQQLWYQAIRLYEKAAQVDNLWAQVELAKYYENHAKDYERAIYWCERMLMTIDNPLISPFTKNIQSTGIKKRLNRIHIKFDKTQ